MQKLIISNTSSVIVKVRFFPGIFLDFKIIFISVKAFFMHPNFVFSRSVSQHFSYLQIICFQFYFLNLRHCFFNFLKY